MSTSLPLRLDSIRICGYRAFPHPVEVRTRDRHLRRPSACSDKHPTSVWKIENQIGHEAGLLRRGTLVTEGIADDPSVADRVVTERVNMPMYPCAGTVSFDHRSEIRGVGSTDQIGFPAREERARRRSVVREDHRTFARPSGQKVAQQPAGFGMTHRRLCRTKRLVTR